VISVAAVDSTKAVASFSQQNDQVELAAPGVAVRSTVPMWTGSEESATVNGVAYEVTALDGSPDASGAGPLVDCGRATSACPGGGGQVCLIERGDITFAAKVQACESGNGVAAIIYNNDPGLFTGTLGSTVVAIPAVGMSDTDGNALRELLGSDATVTTGVGSYAVWDGTSMATPHVAGVAALVWSHNTAWTNRAIRTALDATAEDLGPAGRDTTYGWGLVRAKAALDFLQGGGGGCTPTESPEVSCSDGVDNDCDGLIDIADSDCAGGGTCAPSGAACSSGAVCCSGSCKGSRSGKTCK
jgi:subtilisin family serine protease